MPSDATAAAALAALTAPRADFEAALARTAAEARALLARQRVSEGDLARRLALELGPFAGGRIDPERFGRVLDAEPPMDEAALARSERALAILDEARAEGDALYRARVGAGSDLRRAVDRALGRAGRVFAAARALESARRGEAAGKADEAAQKGLPFREWSRSERQIAPPLVVEVGGADRVPAALADFLDGAVRIALVVEGDAPPAALARLVTPGVFVMQTGDPAALERLAGAPAPGVAAVLPEGGARFVHDPAGGPSSWQRLRVEHLPEPPRRRLGARTAEQQAEDLRHLAALAERPPAAAAAPSGNGSGVDPVDRLAGWLLQQADLSGLGDG